MMYVQDPKASCEIDIDMHDQAETFVYLILIIRLTHANVWESVGKPCSYMQFIKAIFCTTSHVRICISTRSSQQL